MSFLKYNEKVTLVNVIHKHFSMSALLSVKVTLWTHLACFTAAVQLRIKKPSLNLKSRVPCHPGPSTQDSGIIPDSHLTSPWQSSTTSGQSIWTEQFFENLSFCFLPPVWCDCVRDRDKKVGLGRSERSWLDLKPCVISDDKVQEGFALSRTQAYSKMSAQLHSGHMACVL